MTFGLLVLLGALAALALEPILMLVGEPGYSEHKYLLWPVLLITAVLALVEIPRTALYAELRELLGAGSILT